MEAKEQGVRNSKIFVFPDVVAYVPNSVIIKTILKNLKGDIKAFSIDSGQVLEEKSYPFDTMVQVIDGEAEVTIKEISSTLNKGEAIIIPAYSSNSFKANERFKMILTVLKSGARMQVDCPD
ncbi:MAG: cupin domain-containing protein [Cyclobacteriaceae bacterium]